MTTSRNGSSQEILHGLEAYIAAAASQSQDSKPIKPSHRKPFHWPPHPVSKDYHVLSSDWTGKATLDAFGEVFEVDIARTAQGVFGRIEKIWNEARGESVEEVLDLLKTGAQPYFDRQQSIGATLGTPGRYVGRVSDLESLDLVKLLYCPDRDVAHEAQLTIETHASSGIYSAALVRILLDDAHPHRRIAQWCVLDMFEDLPSFCPDSVSQEAAVEAIRKLIMDATDDYARTIYKAGVVLGGHVCTPAAAEALIDCTGAPSKFGRRSAIHAVFHLAEWMPEYRDRIVATLEECSKSDAEQVLREFAASMARDVRVKAFDHMTEPAFPEEV